MFKLPKWLRSIWGLLIPSPWRTGDIATFPSRYGGLSRCENASWISILKLWLNFSMVQLRFLYFLRFVENSYGCKVKFDKVWFIWERFAFSGFSFYFSEGSNIKKKSPYDSNAPPMCACARLFCFNVRPYYPPIEDVLPVVQRWDKIHSADEAKMLNWQTMFTFLGVHITS